MFKTNETWIIARGDMHLQTEKEGLIDPYFLIDAASGYVFEVVFSIKEQPKKKDVTNLFDRAFSLTKTHPKELLFPKGDPAFDIFSKEAQERKIIIKEVPSSSLELLINPIIESFKDFMFKKPRVQYPYDPEQEKLKDQAARDLAPDSYDPCPCASAKKFKFCCKPAYQEIVMAMSKAQNHHYDAALDYMKKAEAILGKTAEVLCRYAVVYSFFDMKKFHDYLKECLKKYPHHPRANYLQGIQFKEDGNLEKAVESYQKAIQNYPKTDKYHLNETLNNLGSIYFDLGQYFEAKAAWEKALIYIPYDRVVRNNLKEFIYDNPDLSEHLRQMSPFIKRIFESTNSLEI